MRMKFGTIVLQVNAHPLTGWYFWCIIIISRYVYAYVCMYSIHSIQRSGKLSLSAIQRRSAGVVVNRSHFTAYSGSRILIRCPPLHTYIHKSFIKTMAERIEFTLNKNINKTVNQSISQSINQSINQAVSQWIITTETRWAGQSPTWGRPAPQFRVQNQFE